MVARTSFERAVGHIAQHGDTDVFPFPAENHMFYDRPTELADELQATDQQFDDRLNVDTTTGVSAMAPAGYTGFRWATQLDPLWNAYLLGLVVELAPKIEATRVGGDVVHSHHYESTPQNAELFVRDGFRDYEAASVTTAQDFDWVVVTDIADFYPRIYHHRLENVLIEVAGDAAVPKRIMRLLDRWSNNRSYGLPVGGPAARLLSELLLDRTDKLLQARGRRFHRYADDYRLFATSRQDAHRALAELSEVLLRNEGLSLSKQKTRLMTRAEFISTIDSDGQGEDDESDLSEEQIDRRRRARELLGLSLRFDPYSPTAVEDYEALKSAVERIDIVDLFMMELSKPRMDPRLVRRLLRALDAAEASAKGTICTSLVQNLELLAPLVPQVLQAVRRVLGDVEPSIASEARTKLAELLRDRSYVFDLEVNRAFAVRVLADSNSSAFETQFIELFEGSPAFIQRDIVIAMARWRASYWLSDKKTQFDTLHPWVKRSMIMASYYLGGDEGAFWRRSIRNRLSPFDLLTRDWVADKVQTSGWELPL